MKLPQNHALPSALCLLAASSFPANADVQTLNGAGATLPYPLLAKWFEVYKEETGVQFNYQAIGEGGGLKQLAQKTTDFAVVGAPLDAAAQNALGFPVQHVPLGGAAISVSYNLPTLKAPLRLSGAVLAAIYLGKIKHWDDAKLQKLNPRAPLPHQLINVIRRADNSPATRAFAGFLAVSAPYWAREISADKNLIRGASGDGLAHRIKATSGSIGTVELAYAQQNQMPSALIANRAGVFVAPSSASTFAGMQNGAAHLENGAQTPLVNPRGAASYPLFSVFYLVMPRQSKSQATGAQLRRFARWALRDGQKLNATLLYAPLPENLREVARRELDALAP